MAQHDMDVANQTFTATRADMNAALQALVSNNSGATAPATTFAYQWWADTTSGILKQRNAANSAWVNVLTMATGVPTGAAASGVNGDISKMTGITDYTGSFAFRSYLSGLTLSTAGASATMSIAAGVAMDGTNTYLMQLAATSKTTALWAVGSAVGGLDTGAIAINSWYHFYVIRRPDTGVVDVVFSLSASAPTLPTNYTQFRRIGSGRTNASSQWTKFIQDGDNFQWDAPVLDVDVTNPGSAAVTRTLSVPTGVNVRARFNYIAADPSNANQVLASFTDLAIADSAPSFTASPLADAVSLSTSYTGGAGKTEVRTNTSAQIRSRLTGNPSASATLVLRIATTGWADSRGRDA